MTSYLREHKDKLTELVNDSIRETFRTYFQIDVDVEKVISFKPIRDGVTCRTEIDDTTTIAALIISIEKEMLIDLAATVYGPEMAKTKEAYESCAMEITNIVCSRIKTYFNDHGYSFGMHLPQIVAEDAIGKSELELLFSVKEDKLVVDLGINKKEKVAGI